MTTKETLLEVMKQNGITKVSLLKNCGTIEIKNDDLVYDYEYAFRYYPNCDDAFQSALCQIKNDLKKIKDVNSNKNKVYYSTINYVDFDRSQYNKDVYKIDSRYPSDIIDSGVTITDDTIVSGTLNQMRLFMTYTNNHHRYCRCANNYNNEEVKELITIGVRYGLFSIDSFNEYYHNSIVD